VKHKTLYAPQALGRV